MRITPVVLVGGAALFAVLPQRAHGGWVCWTTDQGRRIQCAQPDGSEQADLLIAPGKPMGMAVDRAAGTLYWAEREPNRIWSLDLEGVASATSLVQVGLGAGLRGMAISTSAGKVFWVAENFQKIQRANLDGSQVEDLTIPVGSFFDVEVDDSAGMLYWTNGAQIWRGNLDGSGATAIVGDADQPYYLALDLTAGKLYWTDFAANEIGRSNLDGSAREVPGPIHGLVDQPIGVALDVEAGKVYWTLDSGAVQRADLDGTNIETVANGLESTWDITVVASLPTVAAIPAASTWSLVILVLGLLTAGTVFAAERQPTQPVVA